MIFTGLFVVLLKPASADAAVLVKDITTWDKIWEGSNWNWGLISKALFQVFYSYAGLENVNNVMNEVSVCESEYRTSAYTENQVKNPVKTLKSVAPAGLISACVLYVLVNIAYFLVVPIEEIKESGEMIAALFFERVFGQSIGRTVLPLAVAISAAGVSKCRYPSRYDANCLLECYGCYVCTCE